MFTRRSQLLLLRNLIKMTSVSEVLADLAQLCREKAHEADAIGDQRCLSFWEWQMSYCSTAFQAIRDMELWDPRCCAPAQEQRKA
jgi:hypothetical protein